MNTKTKRTEGRWRVGYENKTAIICETLDGKVPTIAKMSIGYADVEEVEANAEMICKAVNNHDKLVDMLSSLVWLMTDDETGEIYEDYKLLPESTMKNAKKLLESLK